MYICVAKHQHTLSNATQKYTKKNRIIAEIVKNYFKEVYTESFSVFDDLENKLGVRDFNEKEEEQLKRLVSLFFLGQLVGLPTLNSILENYGISNGKHQRNHNKICKKLSLSTFKVIFEDLFEQQLGASLAILSEKHTSCFSREPVTVILDDSIFRQWLTGGKTSDIFEGFYGRFFSGQCGRAVFGFKVVTLGVSISEVFYPLYYELVKKSPAKEKVKKVPKQAGNSKNSHLLPLVEVSKPVVCAKEKKAFKTADDLLVFSGEKVDSAISMAIKLVKRFVAWKGKLAKNGILLPPFYFSCDSGYSHELLAKICENNDLYYISVVKKPHNFQVNGVQIKAANLIENTFLKKEKQHQDKEKHLAKNEKTAFCLRIKANYCSQNNKKVVLLIFRLNHSNKVTIIYTTQLEVKAKTLRKHWFARTYIEQFFKILKHVLKIQQTITKTKQAFEIKLLRFFFVALHVQRLIKTIRKTVKCFEKKGFIALQRILNNEEIITDLLQKYAA